MLGWIAMGLVGWMLGVFFVLILMHMTGERDRTSMKHPDPLRFADDEYALRQ